MSVQKRRFASFFPSRNPPPWMFTSTGRASFASRGRKYVHPVTGPAIAHVVRVRREELVLWERICRVVPREKALELLLLLRRLGADHFFQHICRCLS